MNYGADISYGCHHATPASADLVAAFPRSLLAPSAHWQGVGDQVEIDVALINFERRFRLTEVRDYAGTALWAMPLTS